MLAVMIFNALPVYALEKDETVYTKLDNTGKVKNTSAVERLSCTTDEDIKDLSNLEDILNISGDEKYTKEENTLTWKANGNDISYSGTINKELPISVKITYYLDGKEKKLEDILGKKGNVTIKLSYENKDSHYVNGNRLYTPFVAVVGTIIDTDNNYIIPDFSVFCNAPPETCAFPFRFGHCFSRLQAYETPFRRILSLLK